MTQHEQAVEVGQETAKSKSTKSKRTSSHARMQLFITRSTDRCPATTRKQCLANLLKRLLLFQERWLTCPNGKGLDVVPVGGHGAGRGPLHLPGVLLSPHSHGLVPGGRHVRGQAAL